MNVKNNPDKHHLGQTESQLDLNEFIKEALESNPFNNKTQAFQSSNANYQRDIVSEEIQKNFNKFLEQKESPIITVRH